MSEHFDDIDSAIQAFLSEGGRLVRDFDRANEVPRFEQALACFRAAAADSLSSAKVWGLAAFRSGNNRDAIILAMVRDCVRITDASRFMACVLGYANWCDTVEELCMFTVNENWREKPGSVCAYLDLEKPVVWARHLDDHHREQSESTPEPVESDGE